MAGPQSSRLVHCSPSSPFSFSLRVRITQCADHWQQALKRLAKLKTYPNGAMTDQGAATVPFPR